MHKLSMNLHLTFILALSFITISSQINATKVEITRRIENKGYHRFLTTQLRIISNDTNLLRDDCRLLLLENFDKNLYVDVYELRQSMYETMYTFFLSNKVNTETAGYKSQNFQIFLYLAKNEGQLICGEEAENNANTTTTKAPSNPVHKLNCTLTIKLPIHVRYHSPKSSQFDNTSQVEALDEATVHELVENRTLHDNDNKDDDDDDHDSIDNEGETNEYFRFRIRKPRLFFSENCTNPKLAKQSGSKKAATEKIHEIELPCRKNKSIRNDYLFFMPDDLNMSNLTSEWLVTKYKSACKWKLFKFDQLNQSDSLIIQIPTGNRDHEIIILIVTCVVLTFLAFSLAKCVRRRIASIDCSSRRGRRRRGKSNEDEQAANADDNEANEAKDLNPKS